MKTAKKLQSLTTIISVIFMILSIFVAFASWSGLQSATELATSSGKQFSEIDPASVVAGYEAIATASGFMGGLFVGAIFIAALYLGIIGAIYNFIPSLVGMINGSRIKKCIKSDNIPQISKIIKSDAIVKIIFNSIPTVLTLIFIIGNIAKNGFDLFDLIIVLISITKVFLPILQRIVATD